MAKLVFSSQISSPLRSISADTQTDLPLESAEMQVCVGLHLNSAICIPARRPGSRRFILMSR